MNLETMQTILKRAGFDATDPLTAWVNAAMHDLEDNFDWPWLEAEKAEIVAAAGASTIVLPADALKIITLRDITNKYKLDYYTMHQFIREIEDPTEKGLAEIYTLVGTNKIKIWRVLQSETKFEVHYQATTADLANPADEPTTAGVVWPVNTHYPIVQNAIAKALLEENEEERAKGHMDAYEKSLENLRRKFSETSLDEPQTVQDVQGYGSSSIGQWVA